MSKNKDLYWLNPKNWANDLAAGAVVFLVALPLCLGIALACKVSLFSGIIAGIIGGTIVVLFSNSSLGVAGPAAGLTAVVIDMTSQLGSYSAFLLVIVIAGLFQIIFGIIKGGGVGHFFPTSVIKGLLAGIGIIIIIKQIPVLVGVNNLSQMGLFHPKVLLVGFFTLVGLIILDLPIFKQKKIFKMLPASLIMVLAGTIFAFILELPHKFLVNLPKAQSLDDFIGFFQVPDFSLITNPTIYLMSLTLAVVASLETLLCLEATDKIDPYHRTTSSNRELMAQGIGNILSGLIGGLPITQVIVRSSVNINSGGKTKMASMFHGILLLVCVAFIPQILNFIPLASLAAILIMTGYKLSSISLYKAMKRSGNVQFISFMATVIGIVSIDLLTGVALGMFFSIIFLLYKNYSNSYFIETDMKGEKQTTRLNLAQDVSFLNKGPILKVLNNIPNHSLLIIDFSKSTYVDHDVRVILQEFEENTSKLRNIETVVIKTK